MSQNGHDPSEPRLHGHDLENLLGAPRWRHLRRLCSPEELVQGRGLVEPKEATQLRGRFDRGALSRFQGDGHKCRKY